jgi:hypothetical protein
LQSSLLFLFYHFLAFQNQMSILYDIHASNKAKLQIHFRKLNN